jgi:hypothetical protein
MNKNIEDKRFNQLKKQVFDGLYGTEVINDSIDYKKISGNSVETFLKNINDFYSKDINPIFRPYPHALIEIILTLYFKNYKKDIELSDCFPLIFQQDIKGITNTSIRDKYLNMLDAGHAAKQSIKTNNPLIIWELAKNSFLSYNEFLNILVGIILINYRFSIGKSYKYTALKNPYGNKVNELINLNPEAQCYKYLFELLKPEIRNAIGHQTIWFNKSEKIVTYLDDKTGQNTTISIENFMFLNKKASYLAEAYLVAISTIALFIIGNPEDKAKLPKELFLLLMDIISSK